MFGKLTLALATAAVLGTAALAPSAAEAGWYGRGYGHYGYGYSHWHKPFYGYGHYGYKPYRFGYPRYFHRYGGWKRFGYY
jgi:hypothetical protein